MEHKKKKEDEEPIESLSWKEFFEKTPFPSDDFLSEREDTLPQLREGLADVHAWYQYLQLHHQTPSLECSWEVWDASKTTALHFDYHLCGTSLRCRKIIFKKAQPRSHWAVYQAVECSPVEYGCGTALYKNPELSWKTRNSDWEYGFADCCTCPEPKPDFSHK